MSSLREVAEAARRRLRTRPWNGCGPEFHRLVTPEAVSTLLDAVDALAPFAEAYPRGSYPLQPDSNTATPQDITVGDYRRAYEALARLPEEVRRG